VSVQIKREQEKDPESSRHEEEENEKRVNDRNYDARKAQK